MKNFERTGGQTCRPFDVHLVSSRTKLVCMPADELVEMSSAELLPSVLGLEFLIPGKHLLTISKQMLEYCVRITPCYDPF
jgi:hypothetical protein